MSAARILSAIALSLATAACAMGMPEQQATIENLRVLRAADISPVNVGEFTLAPGLRPETDRSIAIRAVTVSPPNGGTFTGYLRQTLITELTADGKFDANSSIVIGGRLNVSKIDAGIGTAHATLGATFTVSRGGNKVYEKALEVHDDWSGDFLGAVAIPSAMDHYTALYSKLVGALLADGEFRAAMHRTP
jgi:hypothetical protein